MKKLFFIISVVIIPFIAKGQDTLVHPYPDMLYSSCDHPDSIDQIGGPSVVPHIWAIENYGENTHTIYGIAVTAKFPIPANSTLRFYERIDGAVRITDTIAGQTVPYPFNYYIKYYLYRSATTTASKTIPCFLYLFDTPHKKVDTFYVGLNAPRSVWMDTNQIYLYDEKTWNCNLSSNLSSWMYINEDMQDPYLNLYDRVANSGMDLGPLYPLIGLPCTAPQAPSISVVGDSLQTQWTSSGEFCQLRFRNTDRNSITFVSDTLADTLLYLPDTLLTPGNYEVQLRKACRYTTASYDTLAWSPWGTPAAFTVSSPAGITRIDQAPSFSLFPNPARGSVTIVMDEPSGSGNGERQLTLLDLQGREIATISHLSGNTFSLDLGPLAPGTYLIRLTTPDATAHQRLVSFSYTSHILLI